MSPTKVMLGGATGCRFTIGKEMGVLLKCHGPIVKYIVYLFPVGCFVVVDKVMSLYEVGHISFQLRLFAFWFVIFWLNLGSAVVGWLERPCIQITGSASWLWQFDTREVWGKILSSKPWLSHLWIISGQNKMSLDVKDITFLCG